MVWGAISDKGALPLVKISTKMCSNEYTRVLDKGLKPFLNKNASTKWTFQHDNAPVHTSKQTN